MSNGSSESDEARGYAPPNYTQIPNVFLDEQMPKIHSLSELKVVMAVMRKTFGWQKDEDEISISQLEDLTGLSRPSVNEGVKAALQHKIITRRKVGNGYCYRLNVKADSSKESLPKEKSDKNLTSKDSLPEVVKKVNPQVVKNLNPQKKVSTKEKKETLRGEQGSNSQETESQRLTREFYDRVKGRYRIQLDKEQFDFHLGHFRNMLAKDDPPDEQEKMRVIAHMVEIFPKSPKTRATTALQDVRLGRDTGEAWSGPAPWEEAKRAEEPDPYKNLTDFTYSAEPPPKKQTDEEKEAVRERIKRKWIESA